MFESWGRPPAQYNPYVHGPYNPGRYYGKDANWKQVKLAEIPAWISRRSLNPVDWNRAFQRALWRWSQKWLDVKKIGSAPIMHTTLFFACYYYFIQYRSHTDERRSKYHW